MAAEHFDDAAGASAGAGMSAAWDTEVREEIRRLLMLVPNPQLTTCYANAREAVTIAEYPTAIIMQDPTTPGRWSSAAYSLGRVDWSLIIYVFVGMRARALEELEWETRRWVKPIADILQQNIQLGGLVDQIGDAASDELFSFEMRGIAWNVAEPNHYGLVIRLPITMKMNQPMGI